MGQDRIGYIINNVIDANLKRFYFKDLRLYGICRHDENKGRLIPMRYKGFGDNEYVGLDDKYGMTAYHRVIDFSENDNPDGGFGKNYLITETYRMRLIVFANQRKINDANYDAGRKITDDFKSLIPNKLTKSELAILNAQRGRISITGINTLKQDVFRAEMPGEEYKLKPEHLLFQIEYSVELTFLSSCKEVDCPIDPPADECPAVRILNEDGSLNTSVDCGDSYMLAAPPPGLDINPWQATGMLFYAEASRETAYADNDLVGSITDMTANANHATAAGTNRATYKTNVLNSLASYRFLGDDLHVTGNITCRYPILFIVFRTSTNAMIAELAFTGATLHLAFITDKNVFVGNMLNHSKAAAGGGDASRFPTNASDMSDNINRNVRIQTNSNFQGLEIWYNNVLQTPFTDSVTGTPGTADITGNFSIGARNTGTLFMTGDIYAIGLADAHFMSAIDVQRISRYLANRFAITDNLP